MSILEAMDSGEVSKPKKVSIVEQFWKISMKSSKEGKRYMRIMEDHPLPPMQLKGALHYEMGIFKLVVLKSKVEIVRSMLDY